MSLGENQLYGRAGKKKKSLMGRNFSGFNPLGCFFCCCFLFFPYNRDWVENADQLAFLEAATKKEDQHMADRPPLFPSHAYASTEGTSSQNVSPIRHLTESKVFQALVPSSLEVK